MASNVSSQPAGSNEPIFFSYMIRLVAFFAVVLFHFNVAIIQFYPNSMLLGKLSYANQTVGDMAISLFIITSGFSLEMSTRGKFELKKYLVKRFISIFPAFWICYLIVGLFLFMSSGHLTGDNQHWKFILSVIGMDGFFLYKMQNYYLVGEWYTGYMLLTYLLFPFLLIGIRFNPFITSLVLMILFTVIYINYHKYFDVYINCNPLMRLPDFMFGMIFSRFIYNNKKRFYSVGILSVIIIVTLTKFFSEIPAQLYMLIFGCCLYSILSLLFDFLKHVKILLKPVSYMAGMTFTAFLVHHQIIYYLFPRLNYSSMTNIEAYYYFFAICALSLIIAIILSPTIKLFEKTLKNKLLS